VGTDLRVGLGDLCDGGCDVGWGCTTARKKPMKGGDETHSVGLRFSLHGSYKKIFQRNVVIGFHYLFLTTAHE
jgi:hypothetical protein